MRLAAGWGGLRRPGYLPPDYQFFRGFYLHKFRGQEVVVSVFGTSPAQTLTMFQGPQVEGMAPPPAAPGTARPDLHVFVFGGDGDAFSIGGNHFNHTARKNIKMTYVVMDNWVYGLTKKQTSPTSPIACRSPRCQRRVITRRA